MSFFLAFSLLFSAFAVNSFAASTVTYRLADFEIFGDSDTPSIFSVVTINGRQFTRVAYTPYTDVRVTAFRKISDQLKIGTSYTLTFTASLYYAGRGTSCSLFLADDPDNMDNAVELCTIDTKNFTAEKFYDYSVQFQYPEKFSGKQCYLVALVVAPSGENLYMPGFYVSDFVFTDNNAAEEEKIDSILEWLSALYHSVVGGEDSRGVQHDGLVQGIKNGLSGLGDRISTFFEDLKNNITTAFDSLKEKLTAIGDDIKAKFQEIADSFTEFFDKFKPRVYEEFLWHVGGINASTGGLLTVPSMAYTSDVFYVSPGSKYLIDVLPSVHDYIFHNIRIAKYNSKGQFVTLVSYTVDTISNFSFEEGFNYRISIELNQSLDDLDSYDLSKLCNSFVKIYCDEGWINALIHAFMNGLKQLFIPGPGYFDGKLDDFLEAYEDHFGIFAQATVYFTKAIQKVQEILSDTYSFVFPELSVTIQGHKYVFSEKRIVDIGQWLESGTWSANLYEMYRVFASAFLIYLVLLYARKVEAVILNNTPELAEEGLVF